jgi:hypothetical protein
MAIVADFDDDGDPDVLGTRGRGAESNPTLVWARNDGGGRFTILENIDPGHGDFLQGTAMGSFHGGRQVALSWHAGEAGIELLNVPPDPSRERWTLSTAAPVTQHEALSVDDVDADGDGDLVVGEHNLTEPDRARLIVLENLDGQGGDWVGHVVWKGDEHHDGALLTDIDGDGDQDIVSIGWSHGRVLLYENLSERR